MPTITVGNLTIRSIGRASPPGGARAIYTITASGRKQLGKEVSGYERAVWAIARVLNRV
jgi:hypothetical protein